MFVLTKEEKNLFFSSPSIIRDEALFLITSVVNILLPWYFASRVMPFPILITWLQMIISSLICFILGEFGLEFKEYSIWAPYRINFAKVKTLLIPSLVNIAVVLSGNILLTRLGSPSYYSTAVSLAVVAHHFTRFLGCGEVYRPRRWSSILTMFIGFLIFCSDSDGVAQRVVGASIIYGMLTAFYRAALLERALHEVYGNSNELQAVQNYLGMLILPLFILLSGEYKFLRNFPRNLSLNWRLLILGCFVTNSLLGVVKNIISNHLIRTTGQSPWRIFELIAMIAVFVIGLVFFHEVSFSGILAFALVLIGRALNSSDSLSDKKAIALEAQGFANTNAVIDENEVDEPIAVASLAESELTENV